MAKHIIRRFNLYCKRKHELLCVGCNYRDSVICFVNEHVITHRLERFIYYLENCEVYIEWFDE